MEFSEIFEKFRLLYIYYPNLFPNSIRSAKFEHGPSIQTRNILWITPFTFNYLPNHLPWNQKLDIIETKKRCSNVIIGGRVP